MAGDPERDPWPSTDDPPDLEPVRPGPRDAHHVHRCRGCHLVVNCYGDGCATGIFITCGVCWASGRGDGEVT